MKKDWILLILITIFVLSGCSNSGELCIDCDTVAETKSEGVEKVEVFHFHRTNQCYSCITIGKYAEETVNTYFANELSSGKIAFGHINIDLPENKDLVMKYGATGSSLLIGVYDNGGFHAEENVNVWYKINDKQDFMDYLKEVIDKRLSGDFK